LRRGVAHVCRIAAAATTARMTSDASLAQPRPIFAVMIRKLRSGKWRLYSRKIDPRTGKRRNLGTFDTRQGAERHERAVQYFKRAKG
jgi:hypothetical protein